MRVKREAISKLADFGWDSVESFLYFLCSLNNYFQQISSFLQHANLHFDKFLLLFDLLPNFYRDFQKLDEKITEERNRDLVL